MTQIITCCIALALSFAVSAQTQTLTGKVIRVADGDTLTILVDQTQYKIRLAEIDAPEKGQPFGTRSKQHLSDLCFDRQATVTVTGKDRYKRTIGRVECDGKDANLEQVKAGMAWAYIAYLADLDILAAEAGAKANKVGLWVDSHPVPPWKWRQRVKN